MAHPAPFGQTELGSGGLEAASRGPLEATDANEARQSTQPESLRVFEAGPYSFSTIALR